MRDFLLGAVAYDAKVVPIWEGFRTFFIANDLPFDFVLYSNYERQVAAHLAGEIDTAWNSPLAWIQADRWGRVAKRSATAIAMRDTDRDLTSLVVVRADSPYQGAKDLSGKKIGVGAADSPQATLIPLSSLAQQGVEGTVVRHDVLVGKHGDHIGGEREAIKALLAGQVDAACIIDGNRLAFTNEGLIGTTGPTAVRVVHQTAPYDHCNFTVFDNPHPNTEKFTSLLLGMSYDDPALRPLLDMEGLKKWLPGRVSGYDALEKAVDRYRYLG